MTREQLENIVRRQLRPTGRQWEEIRAIAGGLGIACNGRGCCNYKLDIALKCALELRKRNGKEEEEM